MGGRLLALASYEQHETLDFREREREKRKRKRDCWTFDVRKWTKRKIEEGNEMEEEIDVPGPAVVIVGGGVGK
jgi:hypothetical protein